MTGLLHAGAEPVVSDATEVRDGIPMTTPVPLWGAPPSPLSG